MRDNFFLRQKWITLTMFVMVVGFFGFDGTKAWACLIFGGLWLFLHRRKHLVWRDTLKSDGEIFLSPVDGQIVKIGDYFNPETQEKLTEIRINTSHYNCWGLYLPSSSEMSYLKETQGARFPRGELASLSSEEIQNMSKTDLILKSKNGLSTQMRFIQCVNGRSPRIFMKSGDRGRGAACFGYYPFGGSLIIFVPQRSDILVVEKEKITAGETVLAVFRSAHEEQYGI